MSSQFQAAINQLIAEKNLPKDVVMEAIESAIKVAYRKDYGTKDHEYEVELSDGGANSIIYQVFNVVDEVEDEFLEITVKEAQQYKKGAKSGDVIKIDVTPLEFGRIAAQSAKQVIIQKLQEAEKEILYETFKDRENELLNAQIHRVQNEKVFVDLEKIIVELPKEHQIPGERYYAGQRVKLFLDKVLRTPKGTKLLISRTHPELVKKLLELEIPEVTQGIVNVDSIAREPGVRSKIAVSSSDEKVDPIGACVGQKGIRIQALMDELNGERIDVIKYTDNKLDLLRLALAPAKTAFIDLDEEANTAKVYVEEDQRPLAIGRKGQNVRLASQLVKLEVDILDAVDLSEEDKERISKQGGASKSEAVSSSAKQDESEEIQEIASLELDSKYTEALENANLSQVEQLKGLSIDDLQTIEGIDEEGAKAIHEAIKQAK